MRRAALLVLPVILAASALAQPSFDCAKAVSDAEKTICSDPNADLAASDAALARIYKALKQEGGHDGVLGSQKAWLANRDACGVDRECIAATYEMRLQELARAAGDTLGISGRYRYQHGSDTDLGTLMLIREADGTLSGAIDTVSGPTYHQCYVSFQSARQIGDKWLWEGPAEEAFDGERPCRVLIEADGQKVRIDSLSCRYYCGARGYFDETYARLK